MIKLNYYRIWFFIVIAGISILGPKSVEAQNWDEIIKITASDDDAEDLFGYSVSISGNKAIVGAHQAEASIATSGFAYIFELVSGVWIETGKLVASDAEIGDQFGYSVSISGERAIIGAFNNDDGGENVGSAYVFELIGGAWIERQKILASDRANYDYFGKSVCISGERVIVGAYGNDDGGSRSGSAYIFKLFGNVWLETGKLLASDAAIEDDFGNSVSISGDKAIVGAYNNDDAGNRSGSAYIFELNGGVWGETQKLLSSDISEDDYFGNSVSISGDYAIIGAYLNHLGGSMYGSAYVYELSNGVWLESQKLLPSDTSFGNWFGHSVSISGNKAIVGAPYNDEGGSMAGAAYVFELIGGDWLEVDKLISSDIASDDWLGYSVSVSENVAIVGAYGNDDWGSNSGSAYIFGSNSIGVGVADFSPLEFKIEPRPNPTKGIFIIDFVQVETNSIVTVYDMLGKVVENEQISTDQISIDLSGNDKGIYFVNIQTENGNIVRKIILD